MLTSSMSVSIMKPASRVTAELFSRVGTVWWFIGEDPSTSKPGNAEDTREDRRTAQNAIHAACLPLTQAHVWSAQLVVPDFGLCFVPFDC